MRKHTYEDESNQSKNEFMMSNFDQSQVSQSQQGQRKMPEEFEKMYSFMSNMMKNPELMASFMGQKLMEESQVSQPDTENHRRREYQLEQHKYRNHQASPKAKQQRQHRKGQDILKRYPAKTQNQHPNKMAESTVSVEEATFQKPKKQEKIQQFQKPIPKVSSFDEMPIKSNYIENIQNNPSSNPNNLYEVKQADEEIYKAADQRPIQGITGNFKQHLKNLPGIQHFPQGQQFQERQENFDERPKEAKPFLKRGTRQHLSSAKGRAPVRPKKKTQQPSDPILDKSSDRIDMNKNRSISQNRLLNKKRTEKSVNKVNSRVTEKVPQTQISPRNKKAKKVQDMRHSYNPSIRQEQNSTPVINKKKTAKTNVFEDDSSDNEEQAKTRIRSKYSTRELPKDEVLPGVFLTKHQLQELLQKHSRTKSNFQDQKIKELKKKYLDLCNIAAQEKQYFEKQIEKQKQSLAREREQFQAYKSGQIAKLKNEKKIQQRQLQSRQTQNQSVQKEREELENLRKDIEREKQEFRKKEKNNRIMLDKYKKEAEDLKMKFKLIQGNKQQTCINCKNLEKKQNSRKTHQISKQQPSDDENKRYQTVDIKKNPQIKQKFEYKEKPSEKKIQSLQSEEEEQIEEKEEIVEYSSEMKLNDLTKIPLSIKMVTDQMVDRMFKYQNNPEYQEYMSIVKGYREKLSTTRNAIQRKLTNIFKDGGKEVIFETGVRKQYFPNGYSIIFFNNGDIKQKLTDGTVLYYYRERQVDQITLSNSMNIYRFENNQIEFHFDDKRIQIRHPDGSLKVM